jgi:hypothetical protein
MAFKTVLTFNCIAGHGFVGFRLYSIRKLNEVAGIGDAFSPGPNQRVDFKLKRATGRLPSLQLAPGCGRAAHHADHCASNTQQN